jgi:hypothetical protein
VDLDGHAVMYRTGSRMGNPKFEKGPGFRCLEGLYIESERMIGLENASRPMYVERNVTKGFSADQVLASSKMVILRLVACQLKHGVMPMSVNNLFIIYMMDALLDEFRDFCIDCS